MPKRALPSVEQSQITEKVLFKIASDLSRGVPAIKDKLAIADDLVIGLRFLIYEDKGIALHASYRVENEDGDDRRPFMKLGMLKGSVPKGAAREPRTDEEFTLAEAREMAKNIKAIGDRGIDVEKDARKRLIAELRRDGKNWSPTPSASARKG
jgi:hypothetical protein